MPDALDPSRCPLCEQPNTCGQADPLGAAQPCWCFSIPVDPQALARVPDALQRRACLCPRCARGLPAVPAA